MKIIDKFIEIKQLPYIIAGLIFLCSLGFLHINMEKDKNQILMVNSIEFGHMMSESSNDLTNNARYYVATKNPLWREQFEKILKQRSGEISSDDGRRISFVDRVKEFEYNKDELDVYEQAVKLSNNLAVRETEAFKIILDIREGKVKNIDDLEARAVDLVFGTEYQKYKLEIMDTSAKFSKMVIRRLIAEDKLMGNIEWILIILINVSLIILVMALRHKEHMVKTPIKTIRKKKIIRKRRVIVK
jgi:hypothetical protein